MSHSNPIRSPVLYFSNISFQINITANLGVANDFSTCCQIFTKPYLVSANSDASIRTLSMCKSVLGYNLIEFFVQMNCSHEH